MPREKVTKVEADCVVAVTYVLRNDEDEELAAAPPDSPLVYVHGHRSLIPVLEEKFEGREPGERFTITLDPEEAFGVDTSDETRVLPRDSLPADLKLMSGLPIALEEDGREVNAWVLEWTEHQVVVGFTHPWAGQPVELEAEVLKIRPATEWETRTGETHGFGGPAGSFATERR